MPLTNPYKRTCRPFSDGTYLCHGNWLYIMHRDFANEPQHYVRAFEVIQKDLQEIFDYVEPSDTNLSCYSYRIHALHVRTCIEIEANCRAILEENGYSAKGDWNMNDYRKLDKTHHLSAYEVMSPIWQGKKNLRKPFQSWGAGAIPLDWYQAYNESKHDRHAKFARANCDKLLDAICSLVAILSSQFYVWNFPPSGAVRRWSGINGPLKDFEVAIGGYFHVKFPSNFSPAEQYDFDWDKLKQTKNPIHKVPRF